ncbi:MAG: cysteine desulfurase/selenocysteine lyase [Gammaproteobacteria bacterium]|jgi:cysteine desulfurase/selenocysteine lyase
MPIDIDRVRNETPACVNLIHFNNAGDSLSPQPVIQAITDHLHLEARIGGYEAEDAARGTLDQFYRATAELIGSKEGEIAYIENATRAWDMAFYSIPLERGDEILTHESEYASNFLAYIQQARRHGLKIRVVPSDKFGQIDVEALESMINPRSRLISINHIPTQSGLVNPADKVGAIARKHGLFYLLDACQSVGQMPVDVESIQCDLLSATGRKFLRGPRGTGFLYVRDSILEQLDPPFIDLHSAKWIDKDNFKFIDGTKRFENWESYVAGRIGLTRAIEYALDIGLENIQDRINHLSSSLRSSLSSIPGVTVRDPGEQQCAIVTFDKADEAAADMVNRLRQKNINISFTTGASARLDKRFSDSGINFARASVHYFNTDEEIVHFCSVVADQF